MLVTLGVTAIQYCALMAERRNIIKAGVRSNKCSKLTEWESHYVGIMGEYAVAKQLGLRIDESVSMRGDGKIVDLLDGSLQIQVKTRLPQNPPLYLFYESKNIADRTICAVVRTPATVELMGWITREDFLAKCQEKDFGYGTRYAVTSDQLERMESWANVG